MIINQEGKKKKMKIRSNFSRFKEREGKRDGEREGAGVFRESGCALSFAACLYKDDGNDLFSFLSHFP